MVKITSSMLNKFSFLILIFVLYTAVSSIFAVFLLRLGCVFASLRLHHVLLNGIFHAPLSYFDQTPTGRILSRFSKDLDVVDTEFPMLWDELLYCAFEVIPNF